jgi:hypothetical protein
MFGLLSGLIEVTKQTGVGYNGLESFQDLFIIHLAHKKLFLDIDWIWTANKEISPTAQRTD